MSGFQTFFWYSAKKKLNNRMDNILTILLENLTKLIILVRQIHLQIKTSAQKFDNEQPTYLCNTHNSPCFSIGSIVNIQYCPVNELIYSRLEHEDHCYQTNKCSSGTAHFTVNTINNMYA